MYSVNHVSRISLWFQIELAKREICLRFRKQEEYVFIILQRWQTWKRCGQLPCFLIFSCSGSSSSKLPALLTAPQTPPTWSSAADFEKQQLWRNHIFHQVSSTNLLWQLDVSGFPGRFSRKFHTARHTSRPMTFLWSSSSYFQALTSPASPTAVWWIPSSLIHPAVLPWLSPDWILCLTMLETVNQPKRFHRVKELLPTLIHTERCPKISSISINDSQQKLTWTI